MESTWHRPLKKSQRRYLVQVKDGQKRWKKLNIFRRNTIIMSRLMMKSYQLVLIGETLTTTISQVKSEIKQHVVHATQSLSLKLWNQDLESNMDTILQHFRHSKLSHATI